jgi:hypothetical protein
MHGSVSFCSRIDPYLHPLNRTRAVLLHFLGRVLDIAAGTAVALGIIHDLYLTALVNAERAFPLAQRAYPDTQCPLPRSITSP